MSFFAVPASHEDSAMTPMVLSRRSFLAFSAMPTCALSVRAAKPIPAGLELYSVRDELKKDPECTVRAVAQMGYQGVEFYAPYFEWSENQSRQIRKLLDDLGIRCFSTERKRLSEQDVQLIRNGQQTANNRIKQAISPENNGAEHIADGARRCFSVLVRRIHFFQDLA